VALHTLPYFAQWFGIPYALPKLDMVSLPDFASGAMENWGLVTYRETALLVDPVNSSAAARQRVASVVDHELAHQWFGNLVTMEWWTDLWLNEGFASYVGPKAVDAQFPEWDTWTQFVSGETLGSMHSDSLKNSHPIEIPVKNPHEIREIFDSITYGKGSSVNRMLEFYLGEEVFRRGLRAYLKKYAYANAKTVDLWSALEKASGKPVKAMMASFTKQEGYPVLTVREKKSAGKRRVLELGQKRFLFDGSADKARASWKVPVGARSRGSKKPLYAMMSTRRSTLSVPCAAQDWIKLNPGQSGFYRVAYSPELLGRLIPALDGELAVPDRLGFLDDAFVLARAGELQTTQVLDILAGCEGQTDYNVWSTVGGIVAQIENILGREEAGPYAAFARTLFGRIGRRLGWTTRAQDTPLDLLLRPLVLGRLGHYGDTAVVNEAAGRFRSFAAGGTLDPNLRGAVFAVAAEHGGRTEQEKLFEIYRKSPLQEEKVRTLRALTRFGDAPLVRATLAFVMSDAVRSQDKFMAFTGFGANAKARKLSWEFLKSEWKTVEKLYAGGNVGLLSATLAGSVSGFVTKPDLDDAARFFAAHRVPGTERATRQALEVIRANIAWSARDRRAVAGWLGRRPSGPARGNRVSLLQKA
jgi:puromycin-sensitive aminopeptidase